MKTKKPLYKSKVYSQIILSLYDKPKTSVELEQLTHKTDSLIKRQMDFLIKKGYVIKLDSQKRQYNKKYYKLTNKGNKLFILQTKYFGFEKFIKEFIENHLASLKREFEELERE